VSDLQPDGNPDARLIQNQSGAANERGGLDNAKNCERFAILPTNCKLSALVAFLG
jgi:hypothetical protein